MDPLRIGFLAPEFPPKIGGMSELARGLLTELARRDELTLFALREPNHLPKRVRWGGTLTGRIATDLPLLKALDPQLDCWLALNAGLTPLATVLRRPFFSYFHGNDFLNPWLACGPAFFEALRRPYLPELRHFLRRRAIKRGLRSVRHLFANSRQTAGLIARTMKIDRGAITVCPPGVDEDFFQERKPAAAKLVRLLTVARLSRFTRRKNVDGVLRALAMLPPDLEWRYVVVGDGDDRTRLEEIAEDLCLSDRVEFRGSVERSGLLRAYREADLMILAAQASERDVEGFGMVYTEASAAGVPVLASRAGGAIDAVEDGVNGILIDESSPVAIARGIERFISEQHDLRPHRVRKFAERFRWPKIAAELRQTLTERLRLGSDRGID